ncbi:hypothetical protein [Burkholderia dolosa]|uniref:hypothetical protein n=1 Tax=Burkholderia dolosa TaxID=152500 RepID=UPI0027D29DB3|nr:hypothetical protein [Burkholderia dolosa]
MNWTPPPSGESSAPTWLKTGLTMLHRSLCGLLVFGVLALVAAHAFDIPIQFNTIRIVALIVLAGGTLAIVDTSRAWLLRLPVTTRFAPPIRYGYPGWRSTLQSQLAGGGFLFLFGALLFVL